MAKLRWSFTSISYIFLCFCTALVAAQRARTPPAHSKWQTLSGNQPLVIARGGFSGVFADSSSYAYQLALQTGLPNLHLWCDVQLTKDRDGICFPDIRLENASDIDTAFSNARTTYNVNGTPVRGWFSVSFTLEELKTVNMKQRIYSRAPNFDGNLMPILSVDDVVSLQPSGLWLSIPHAAFFSQHNLSMTNFITAASRRMVINYISSPEVGFLRSIASSFRRRPTKLVFQFLEPGVVEPTLNQTYSSLLSNFTFIKTFAAGIIVPKSYIWPVDSSLYLTNYTSVVRDAHNAGLEVFASNFVNDVMIPYDYGYDPVSEYLSFIDNGQFSVDGVVSDFPLTASAAIDCFSHMGKNETIRVPISVVSSEGASGYFPGCTDSAYERAVSDHVDILDCPVQVTNDGIPFCLGSINLRDRTNAAETRFSNRTTTNTDLNITDGIFAYDLTWSEIQTLKPAISNPFSDYLIYRNPKFKSSGNLMQLSDFLEFANNASSLSGVLINIENVTHLAQKQGLDVIGVVLDTLRNSDLNNQTVKQIMISSSESAVLRKFKSSGNYTLVYAVNEPIRDISNSTILEIKEFASSVVLTRRSVFPTSQAFITNETKVVPKLRAFNISVYVKTFRNEFVSQPWDFFSDTNVEINTHVSYMGVNGVITDYPFTGSRFKRNRCLGYRVVPSYMTAAQPGDLIPLMAPSFLPPALPPNPIWTDADVDEPPIPSIGQRIPTSPSSDNNSSVAASPTSTRNEQPVLVASTIFSIVTILLSLLL